MSSTSQEVRTTLCKCAEGLTFVTVVLAMDFSNISSSIQEEVDEFVRENGLADVPRIFMATHSWGDREWEIVEGRKPAFFREEDVRYLFCASAKSGSNQFGCELLDRFDDRLLAVAHRVDRAAP